MAKRTTKTEATKVPAERTDAAGNNTEQTATTVAEVQNPATVTDAEIQRISGDDGTAGDHNTANQDVRETLEQNRADAKAKKFGDPDVVLGRNGGASGEPG